MTTTSYQSGGADCAGGVATRDQSTADRARVMVTQFSQAKLPGQHQPQLGGDHQPGGGARHRLRGEQQHRDEELGDMVGRHLDPVERLRQPVEEPAQRARHRLGLVVEVQTGQPAPALVAADLDQSGAELDPEQHPAQQPQHQDRRSRTRRCRERRRGSRSPGAATPSRSCTRPDRPGRSTDTAPRAAATAASPPTAERTSPPPRSARPRRRSPSSRRRRRSGRSSGGGRDPGRPARSVRRRNSGTGSMPRSPISARNWSAAARKATR